MALPSIPATLRGIAQQRPIFDPRTGTYTYPGFGNAGGYNTTGNVTPGAGAGAASGAGGGSSTTGTPLGTTLIPNTGANAGGTTAGLRGVSAERNTGSGSNADRPTPSAPTGRVDLTTGLGTALDIAGSVLPGPIGTMATIGQAGIAANNAQYSKDQLQAAGYGTGLTGGQIVGAALGQVTPGGIIGNNLGAGDWQSALAAASAAEKAVSDGRDTYHDPAGYKTSPSGPISRNPTFSTRTAPMPGQAAPTNALGTPSTTPGIRRVTATPTTGPGSQGWSNISGGYDTENASDSPDSPDTGDEVGDSASTRARPGDSGGGGNGGRSGAGVGRGGAGSRDSSGSYN